MEVIYSEECLKHAPKHEILSGSVKPYFESPQRLTAIKNHLVAADAFTICPPADYSLAPIMRVHDTEFVRYLQTAYEEWVEQGGDPDGVLPECFPHPKLLAQLGGTKAWVETGKQGNNALSKAGLYSFDMSTAITGDTWNAAYISCQVALTGAHRLLELSASSGETPIGVYALCRPPGHHAGEDVCGGYCYINNVAVAAQFLIDYDLEKMSVLRIRDTSSADSAVGVNDASPKRKVLILDLDFHHGNGTQSIFYDKPNPLYISLHGTPDYPWFTGTVHEIGAGAGQGYNINVPLPKATTTDDDYLSALQATLDSTTVRDFAADLVLVSLGLDTWHMDPVAGFGGLKSLETYWRMGEVIRTAAATRGRPVLFVQEGGYWIGLLGNMVQNVLDGFLGREMKQEERE